MVPAAMREMSVFSRAISFFRDFYKDCVKLHRKLSEVQLFVAVFNKNLPPPNIKVREKSNHPL